MALSIRNHLRRPSCSSSTFLDVCFERAECCFVALYCELQDLEQSLRRVQVGDNALGYGDRLRRRAHRLRIEPEVDAQLFRSACDSAEIGVAGYYFRIVYFDLGRLRFGSVGDVRGSRFGGFEVIHG